MDIYISMIVNELVPVDVILLPELLSVVVEELVGAVTEGNAVDPESVVSEPALVGADHPLASTCVTVHPVNTDIGQVLNIGAGQQCF